MWCLGQLFLDIIGKVHATQMENYFYPSVLNNKWQFPTHCFRCQTSGSTPGNIHAPSATIYWITCSSGRATLRIQFHVKPIRRRTKASVPKRVNVRSLVDDYEVQTKFQEALASKLNSLDQSSENLDQWTMAVHKCCNPWSYVGKPGTSTTSQC